MSVQKCRHCDSPYWRYRGDHPPKGFCSVPHKEQHAEQKPKAIPPPDKPDVVMRRLKEHNRLFHNADSSMIAWECEACERIQAGYAESLTFHFGRAEQ